MLKKRKILFLLFLWTCPGAIKAGPFDITTYAVHGEREGRGGASVVYACNSGKESGPCVDNPVMCTSQGGRFVGYCFFENKYEGVCCIGLNPANATLTTKAPGVHDDSTSAPPSQPTPPPPPSFTTQTFPPAPTMTTQTMPPASTMPPAPTMTSSTMPPAPTMTTQTMPPASTLSTQTMPPAPTMTSPAPPPSSTLPPAPTMTSDTMPPAPTMTTQTMPPSSTLPPAPTQTMPPSSTMPTQTMPPSSSMPTQTMPPAPSQPTETLPPAPTAPPPPTPPPVAPPGVHDDSTAPPQPGFPTQTLPPAPTMTTQTMPPSSTMPPAPTMTSDTMPPAPTMTTQTMPPSSTMPTQTMPPAPTMSTQTMPPSSTMPPAPTMTTQTMPPSSTMPTQTMPPAPTMTTQTMPPASTQTLPPASTLSTQTMPPAPTMTTQSLPPSSTMPPAPTMTTQPLPSESPPQTPQPPQQPNPPDTPSLPQPPTSPSPPPQPTPPTQPPPPSAAAKPTTPHPPHFDESSTSTQHTFPNFPTMSTNTFPTMSSPSSTTHHLPNITGPNFPSMPTTEVSTEETTLPPEETPPPSFDVPGGGGCGQITTEVQSFFENPSYPQLDTESNVYEYSVMPHEGYCALRIEFLEAILASKGMEGCSTDSVVIVNSADTPTVPLCGLLQGYQLTVRSEPQQPIKLVVTAQSQAHLWKINLTQISCQSIQPYQNYESPDCGVKNPKQPPPGVSIHQLNKEEPKVIPPIKLLRSKRKPLRDIMAIPNMAPSKLLQSSVLNRESNIKIVRGNETGVNEWPWQALLMVYGRPLCGASIINEEWLVTAGHCVQLSLRYPLQSVLTVDLGDHDLLSSKETKNVVLKVEKIVPNAQNEGIRNDIALIKLAQKINFGKTIRPVCFPEPKSPVDTYAGQTGITTGWGRTEDSVVSPVLREAELPIISNERCRQQWAAVGEGGGSIIESGMVCVGGGDVGPCNGDSGGPLVVHDEDDDKYRLVGLTSFGLLRGCGVPGVPSVYARLTSYLDWLALNLAN